MRSCRIFTIPFEERSQEETREALFALAENGKQALVVTPNPEMLVRAAKYQHYAESLRRASLRLVDGIGIVFVARLFGYRLTRMSGVDAVQELAGWAAANGRKIFLAGGLHEGDAARAAEVLEQKYPGLRIASCSGGVIGEVDGEWRGDEDICIGIYTESPDILFLALGNPKQEDWLQQCLWRFKSVHLAMGVGGAIEFLAGRQHRAPQWMRSVGLEWLYRLLREPRRFHRIFTAVIVFPILAIADHFRHNTSS